MNRMTTLKDGNGVYHTVEVPEFGAVTIEHSTAISLRRIADALTNPTGVQCLMPYSTQWHAAIKLAYEAGLAFQDGVKEANKHGK